MNFIWYIICDCAVHHSHISEFTIIYHTKKEFLILYLTCKCKVCVQTKMVLNSKKKNTKYDINNK